MSRKNPQVVTAREIVAYLLLPDKYVRRLMTRLSKAGFVISHQGRSGGYLLAKIPDNISLMNIAEAMHDTSILKNCILGFDNCSDEHPCALHTRWIEIRSQISALFNQASLSELLQTPHLRP